MVDPLPSSASVRSTSSGHYDFPDKAAMPYRYPSHHKYSSQAAAASRHISPRTSPALRGRSAPHRSANLKVPKTRESPIVEAHGGQANIMNHDVPSLSLLGTPQYGRSQGVIYGSYATVTGSPASFRPLSAIESTPTIKPEPQESTPTTKPEQNEKRASKHVSVLPTLPSTPPATDPFINPKYIESYRPPTTSPHIRRSTPPRRQTTYTTTRTRHDRVLNKTRHRQTDEKLNMAVFSVPFPPMAVYIASGSKRMCLICGILTLLGWIPGVMFAVFVISAPWQVVAEPRVKTNQATAMDMERLREIERLKAEIRSMKETDRRSVKVVSTDKERHRRTSPGVASVSPRP